ncbi:endonuclease Q family protein [Cohnella fermenti]|uniref:TIGR00375 family protein n=1 Tax=Cohnella fermenti TaxID=2565925 RepID=A0A4V3WED5_9BACL|nr:endonuclease Q family protein [Cohnella fermenti]THF75852.1 TIGR00375 family protein [Cohnella fermenti]
MSENAIEPNAALRDGIPVFADLHVHIGRASEGEPVKISASSGLTFRSIAEEASERKGVGLVGVIDCHSPPVQRDIMDCLHSGEMEEVPGGGIRYRNTVILPGCEVEVKEEGGGPFHLLVYFPTLEAIQGWTRWMEPLMKNVSLSSQRIRTTARELQAEAIARGGLVIPAHAFTPHRGLLGCSADRLADRLDPDGIAAVELGLSADTRMASRLPELDRCPFLTNSDAHSTGMIGRECNELLLGGLSFAEWALALRGESGRRIVSNLGLHPRLGKYHKTFCAACKQPVDAAEAIPEACPSCGSRRLVRGVAGRIDELAERAEGEGMEGRPPYIRQIPLSFFPGIGPKLRRRLLEEVGTEMAILHRAAHEAIAEVAGEKLASLILAAREDKLSLVPGSGGVYGRIGD